jgi:small subunit ribosomal protein S5
VENKGRDRDRNDNRDSGFAEKLVKLNRTAKVVKGGRRFSFSALTVVGDRAGNVGFGFGKAGDVTEAIRKSMDKAKRAMVKVPVKNGAIAHELIAVYKASKVILKPACPGSGIIAGGPVRAIMEACGVTDVLAKCVGSRAPVNVIRAVFQGVDQMMSARVVAKNRGKAIKDMWG